MRIKLRQKACVRYRANVVIYAIRMLYLNYSICRIARLAICDHTPFKTLEGNIKCPYKPILAEGNSK